MASRRASHQAFPASLPGELSEGDLAWGALALCLPGWPGPQPTLQLQLEHQQLRRRRPEAGTRALAAPPAGEGPSSQQQGPWHPVPTMWQPPCWLQPWGRLEETRARAPLRFQCRKSRREGGRQVPFALERGVLGDPGTAWPPGQCRRRPCPSVPRQCGHGEAVRGHTRNALCSSCAVRCASLPCRSAGKKTGAWALPASWFSPRAPVLEADGR